MANRFACYVESGKIVSGVRFHIPIEDAAHQHSTRQVIENNVGPTTILIVQLTHVAELR
jgi:hypothetical protein